MSDRPAEEAIAPTPRISLQAFCESAELAETIRAAAKDRRLDKAHVKVNMGGAAAAIETFRGAPTPNLIVIECGAARENLLGDLETLADFCDAGAKLIVIGRDNDIKLYRALVARGVSDYLVGPIDALEFIAAVSALYRPDANAPLGRVIAVIGARGGAGASSVAHNLAFALARDLELATILVDLDLAFGAAALNFNQDPPQGAAEAIFAPERLDAAFVDRLLAKCNDKLSLLAAPATLDRSYDLHETALDPLIDLLRDAAPFIVLDLPHCWTAWTRRLLIGADQSFIVAAPELVSLRNAKALFDQLRAARPNDPAPHVVLNGVGLPRRPEIPPADFAKALEAEPAALIPFDAKTFGAAANNGQMIGEIDEGARLSALFGHLARLGAGRVEPRADSRTILDSLRQWLKG